MWIKDNALNYKYEDGNSNCIKLHLSGVIVGERPDMGSMDHVSMSCSGIF